MVPALAASAKAITATRTAGMLRFMISPWGFITKGCWFVSDIQASVDPFQSGNGLIGPLRRDRIAVRVRARLLGPNLILERRLDVGVDQELHAGRETVAGVAGSSKV